MRRAGSVLFLIAIVGSGLAALFLALPTDDLGERANAAIEALDRRLTGLDAARLPKELVPMMAAARNELVQARAAHSPLLRVYRLRDAFVAVATCEFFTAHAQSSNDLTSLRALASERRAPFETPSAPARGAALQLALRQASHNRAQKLFHAAVPYAEASSPMSGLYYLGEAEANRRFAELVMTLPFAAEPDASPSLPAIDAAIDRLDTELLALFASDTSGRSAIGPSARLKEARELATRGSAHGAALLLLEARQLISARQQRRAITAVPGPPPPNDSITALWRAHQDASGVIERDVIPLYSRLFGPSRGPSRPPASVTVTLVRWPYT